MVLSEFKPLLLLSLFCLFVYVNSTPYLVHYLEESTSIEQNEPKAKQPVDIYCYKGRSKYNLFAMWQTAKFQIKTENDTFYIFMNEDPEIVYDDYEKNSYYWSSNLDICEKTMQLSVFKQMCIAIKIQGKYSVDLLVQGLDYWCALSMCIGIAVILEAKSLSGSPTFFYLCGVSTGVFGSYMFCVITLFLYYGGASIFIFILFPILLYVFWNRLSEPALHIFPAGLICIGCILFEAIWEQIQGLLFTPVTLSYTIAISLGVCQNFKIPPPLYKRNRRLIMLALQVLGALLIFISSDHKEVVAAIIVISLCTSYWIQRELIQGRHRELEAQPPMYLGAQQSSTY